MKTLLSSIFILAFFLVSGQTQTRKTRSDKGGSHKHTLGYKVKKATKTSASGPKSKSHKTHSSGTHSRRKH